MKHENRSSIVVEFYWPDDKSGQSVPSDIPSAETFGTTAFLEKLGAPDLFSVYVHVLEFTPDSHKKPKIARIWALVPKMDERLPQKVGDVLVLSTGTKNMARCRVREFIPGISS